MPAKEKEFRNFEVPEIRAEKKEGSSGNIGGYAAVFDKLSEPLGIFTTFRERIAKGAFKEALSKNDIRALWSHDSSAILGRTGNETLKLKEDDIGLSFDLELPDTTLGRDTFTSISRRDITAMSFGFFVEQDDWILADDGSAVRTIIQADLFEISPVAFPAYPQTTVDARELRDLESIAKKLLNKKQGYPLELIRRKLVLVEIE
jgi:HK97 family phage prohead protease